MFTQKAYSPGPERPGTPDLGLAREPPAKAKHALLEFAVLLDAQVRVKEIILQALQARIVDLQKVVRLVWLLVAGWVRGCARLYAVHSGFLSLWAGSRGAPTPAGPLLLYSIHILPVL
jgi:hypothetical protein